MIDECGLCDASRDDVREYDAGSGLYLCRSCRDTEDTWREQSALLALAGRSMASADDLIGATVRFVRHRRTYSGTVVDSLRVGGTLAFHVIDESGRPWSAVRLNEMATIGGE